MQIKTTRSLTTDFGPLTVADLMRLIEGAPGDSRVTITTHPGDREYSPTHTITVTTTVAAEEN